MLWERRRRRRRRRRRQWLPHAQRELEVELEQRPHVQRELELDLGLHMQREVERKKRTLRGGG